MTTLLTSCPYDQLTLERLSDNQLVAKQVKNRQVGRLTLFILVLIVGMAFILDSYMVAITGWAVVPALDDYNKKRKAINKHLQKRRIS